jgi:hypothetical protein
VLFAAVAMLSVPLSAARSQIATEPVGTRGPDAVLTVDNLAVSKDQGKSATNVLTTIYDNASSTPQLVVSSTDLASQWGDVLLTTGTGLLSTHKFTIYNSSTSAGPLLTATVSLSFFDAVTSAPLGAYAGTVNFGAGLPLNNFSIITAGGLDPLLIMLPTTNVLVVQRVTAKTGAASRLGVVSMGPILTGTSPVDMFISSATIGGGVAGFYCLVAGCATPSDPGHFIAVNPPPVGTESTSWGRLKKLYK